MLRALRRRAHKKEGAEIVRSFADPALVIHKELAGPTFGQTCSLLRRNASEENDPSETTQPLVKKDNVDFDRKPPDVKTGDVNCAEKETVILNAKKEFDSEKETPSRSLACPFSCGSFKDNINYKTETQSRVKDGRTGKTWNVSQSPLLDTSFDENTETKKIPASEESLIDKGKITKPRAQDSLGSPGSSSLCSLPSRVNCNNFCESTQRNFVGEHENLRLTNNESEVRENAKNNRKSKRYQSLNDFCDADVVTTRDYDGSDILRNIIGGHFTDLKDSDIQDAQASTSIKAEGKKFSESENLPQEQLPDPSVDISLINSSNDGIVHNSKLATSTKKGNSPKKKRNSRGKENKSKFPKELTFLKAYKLHPIGKPHVTNGTSTNEQTSTKDQNLQNQQSNKRSFENQQRENPESGNRNVEILQTKGTSTATAALIELLSHLEASDSSKLPLSSSRNTQSAARLNRIINVSFGPSYKNGGGSSSTLPHTRTLPCAMPASGTGLRPGHDSMHGRGGSLREEIQRHGSPTGQRMDLVYVTERIISLAFPPDLDGSAYTVHLREVAHMLSSKHGDNFRVFNLSWCQGEVSHYLPRVTELGWPPLLAPALEKLCAVCKALESWLAVNNQHVAVLHDREGYEKLGVVVAAYMHYTNICASTDTALDRYAMKRFFDDKIGQLYHPSQKRYVQYFSGLLSGLIRINSNPLFLHTLTLYGVPHFEPRGGCHLFIKVYQGMTHVYTSGVYQITDGLRHVTIVLEQPRGPAGSHQNNARLSGIQLRGDVLLKAYHRRLGPPPSREVIFRAQFHTCAVSEKVLGFSRLDLDDACNDLRFPLDGGIELSFSRGGDDPPRAVSNVSCDKSPCAITAWDSYDTLHPARHDAGPREPVPHTLGPIDGSLYATVTKRRNNSNSETSINNIKNSSSSPAVQQFEHQQPQQHPSQDLGSSFRYPVDNRIDLTAKSHQHHHHHPSSYSSLRQTPVRTQQDHFGSLNINHQSRSTPHTPQHPSQQQRQPEQQHHGHHTPVATSQHLVHHQHHLSQHHHHHHIHHQGGSLPHHHQHQQYPGSSHPHTPAHTASHTLQHSTPSPHSTAYSNGRYATSIDSGFVGSIAPLSPPTSDCPVSSVSPASAQQPNSGQQSTDHPLQQQQQRSQQVYRRFSDPNQLNMAPVAAVATRPVQSSSSGASSRVDARQLDELLAGMLLDIENIPDLRPGQTPAPDINSIRCPDLSWSSSTRGRSSSSRSGPTMSPVNGYGGSHQHGGGSVSNHDSLLDTSLTLSGGGEDSASAPYHTRLDSRPFSYGAVTSSPVLSRRRSPSPNSSPNRRASREPIISRSGLESPRLVRRMSGSVGGVAGNTTTDSGAAMSGVNTSVLGNGTTNTTRRSPSPSPEPGSRGSTLRRERSQTLTNRIMAGEPSPPTTLTRSHVTRSASRLDDPDTIFAPDTLSRSLSGTSSSWLATQQRKLVERREATRRADRGKHEARVMSELRSRIGQHYNRTNTAPAYSGMSRYGRYGDFEDGYVSDTTLFSDTSRESSPTKHYAYSPLSISTGDPYNFNRDHHYNSINRRTPNARDNSAPSSPNVASKTATLNFARDRLQRLNQHYANTTKTLSLSRKYSDASHDRERPFVTVKRAFAADRGRDSALTQLQSAPLGHVNYHHSASNQSDGLLTTLHQQNGDESHWQSDAEVTHHSSSSGHRPITPGFPPSTPTTPYLNQGLPPKSPTMQRKDPPGSGVHRSCSPHNGHSSPAPSLYHGHPSRRSSLSSLNDGTSSQDVIHSHPKFVKDISKFWYKPTISRDEAINILKTKPPGTFIVRDSNSFPGAFGLAVKVATPPPNVVVSTTGGDPANELVRHFLIEPTARGVRLKGCSNEPVFGSLSALVYQHSITALALPCRLTLPERDPAASSTTATSSSNSTVDNNILLQQGAACTVLYLHSLDTESLTGPQAVKRAVSSLLSSSNVRPTPVHFKVSSAGITLTDNHRTLFFRQHFPVHSISHCGTDPDDRRWQHSADSGEPIASLRMFGFVAKKGTARNQNQCHVLAELEPEQPATAICNFVTKVMMTSANRANLV